MYKSILTDNRQKKLETDKFLAIKLHNEIEEIIAILKPFIDTKVRNVLGSWTKKFDDAIEPIRAHRHDQKRTNTKFKYSCLLLAISNEYKSVYLRHKAWFVYEEHEDYRSDTGEYNELALYIAKIDDDNHLTDLRGLTELKDALEVYVNRQWADYVPKIAEVERLEAEAKVIKDSMPYYITRKNRSVS